MAYQWSGADGREVDGEEGGVRFKDGAQLLSGGRSHEWLHGIHGAGEEFGGGVRAVDVLAGGAWAWRRRG